MFKPMSARRSQPSTVCTSHQITYTVSARGSTVTKPLIVSVRIFLIEPMIQRRPGRLLLARQQEAHPVKIQNHPVAADSLEQRAFLERGAFAVLAHVDIHEPLRRLGREDVDVEMQLGQRLRDRSG